MIDCTVRIIDLPVTVRGLVAEDETGWPSIYLNARLSREMQREALRHELDHIKHGDLRSAQSVKAVEHRAQKRPHPSAREG